MKITNTNTLSKYALKMLIFGEPGAGKTTLAATIQEPTLIISAESGLLSLQGKSIDVVDISTDDAGNVIKKEDRIKRLLEVYQYICTDEARKKYKWIFIDSLTEISQNLIEQLNVEFPDRKDSLVLYGENAKRMRGLVKAFRDLPFYNVVMTALSKTDKDEAGFRFTGVNVTGKIADTMPGLFDEVLYLYVDAEGNRSLITNKTDKLMVKDRSGKLDKLEKPDLHHIASKIKAEQVVSINKQQERVK